MLLEEHYKNFAVKATFLFLPYRNFFVHLKNVCAKGNILYMHKKRFTSRGLLVIGFRQSRSFPVNSPHALTISAPSRRSRTVTHTHSASIRKTCVVYTIYFYAFDRNVSETLATVVAACRPAYPPHTKEIIKNKKTNDRTTIKTPRSINRPCRRNFP